MASLLTELEVLTIMFSLLVFALFTLTGMINEDYLHPNKTSMKPHAEELPPSGHVQMELPFTGFELTFIIIAFLVFSLFGLASVCIEPRGSHPGTEPRDLP
ncbi:hypothetical protein OJAV_G00005050 [Oryzias javanicus]|uniref:Uncharacterized protein n=1 Tax=Oryzias javanicus TaxID=123683 RepID=A0A437DLZ4_ORYJA|nr:hypothetical protein OJAV_G00005050 [Oryzias javanicus]